MKKRWLFGGIVAAVALVAAVASFSVKAASTDYIFLSRGIVKVGGNDLKVYFQHASAKAQSDMLGNMLDVSLSGAEVYQWTKDADGKLFKKRVTASKILPGQEVVIRGAKKTNGTYAASWVVINYRDFTINGKLKKIERDVADANKGWITVEVGNSTYKQSQIVNKDVRMRVLNSTLIKALGKDKGFEDVTADNQAVRVSGVVEHSDYYRLENIWEL